MIRNNAWKTGLSVALALMLVFGAVMTASAADAFSFHNGITWETTVDELKAAEGLTDELNDTSMIYEGSGYIIVSDGEGEDAVTIGYRFFNNQLVMIVVQNMKSDMVQGFYDEKAALVAQYGEPVENQPVMGAAIINMIDDSLLDEEIKEYAGWELDDGTQLFLLLADEQLSALYFNVDTFMAMVEAMMPAVSE